MLHLFQKIHLNTKTQFEIVDITEQVKKIVAESRIKSGIALIYCPHTTAGIKINHNEPLLFQDIMKMLYRLVPIDTSYGHDLFEVRQNIAANERSNGHAHVKSFLLGASETVPVVMSALALGKKQSILFIELDGARAREVTVTILGE